MKKGLSYIIMAIFCGLCFSSCTKDEGEIIPDNNQVPLKLTLSFSGLGGSRATEPDGLDYETQEQAAMDTDDVFVLVFDNATGKLLYQVKDLSLGNVVGGSHTTRTLEGTLLRTLNAAQVKLVVLANLVQNHIVVDGVALDSKSAVMDFIETMIGQTAPDIYGKLIYNYNGSTSWNIANRRIPMWGTTIATAIPPTGQTLSCDLYRAVAKVGIWVNMKEGYDGFVIKKIVANNVNNAGYCVSLQMPDNDMNIQYAAPSIPATGVTTQTVTYDNLNVSSEYVNMIYLPEKTNTTDVDKISLTVYYTYNNQDLVGEINFQDDNGLFDVIRNHSYLFNIQKSDVDATLSYEVVTWVDETITIPAFN